MFDSIIQSFTYIFEGNGY
jgi:hypothetical protein